MKKINKPLLSWFDQHGRKDLPWQQDKTPYRVWVSEIMLQQTQVSTVIPYYQRFIHKFKSIEALAKAKEDEVLHLWTGLGYYSRARNLHKAAKIIVKQGGRFPATLTELIELPGIGRSTAGAILAIAFNKNAPILDGNVKRVLTRFYGITEWPGDKKVEAILWELAEKNTPSDRVADYTQAIMDLGATLCMRGKPNCLQCPLRTNCKAYALGIEKELPRPKAKKPLPIRLATFCLLRHKNKVFLEKRPSKGIWGGLWSLPEYKGHLEENELLRKFTHRFSVNSVSFKKIFRHTFSHFHLDILPIHLSIEKISLKMMEDNSQIWYNLDEAQTIGLPAPIKLLLSEL